MQEITQEQFQLAVEHELKEKEVTHIQVTLDGGMAWFAGKFWHTAWDQIVQGPGQHYNPERSLWIFAVEDGVVVVADSVGEDFIADHEDSEAEQE